MKEKKLSRQRLWQIKQRRKGRCLTCGKPAWRKGSARCATHLADHRERQRRQRGVDTQQAKA
jgi:hypothetical protein